MDKPLVLITWHDAQDSIEPWVTEKEAEAFSESNCEITSVGYLIRKTDRYVTIAGDWNESNKDWGRMTKIPRGMVVTIVDVQVLPEISG